jgi:hypothetical protein
MKFLESIFYQLISLDMQLIMLLVICISIILILPIAYWWTRRINLKLNLEDN